MFSATIGRMLTPSAKSANRFQSPGKTGGSAVFERHFCVLLSASRIFAATDTPVTDGVHKVGLADSRVGYETVSYVTDSKVVIQRSESGSRSTS